MQQESLVEYGSRRVIITVTAIICALLEFVDTSIVNVAMTCAVTLAHYDGNRLGGDRLRNR